MERVNELLRELLAETKRLSMAGKLSKHSSFHVCFPVAGDEHVLLSFSTYRGVLWEPEMFKRDTALRQWET